MLQEAKHLQDKAVANLVEKIGRKDVITFKSPTGSGKTHMMADFMDRILSERSDVVFLVSSLSKSDLAKQNYDSFCNLKDHGEFPHLNPYLISSEVSGEEGVFVPTDYNVYVLPRDLYKKGGRLMQGAMGNFLETITNSLVDIRLSKQVYLIKDECHQATNNLDTISEDYFSKIINISATPKLSRGQMPDVEISEEDAINAKLIKIVEWNENDSDVSEAIEKLEEIKGDYRNLLDVNPCLIIQISNKDKANDDLARIYDVLNKPKHKDLKWMLIVTDQKDCNTNDVFKAKKIPVSKWKDYAKNKESNIDIIIFKMVITEGWDIPRACMLYQMRPTQSDQLDEQVVGRVRRNPRLLDYERLSPKAQELAMKAWVWGVKKKEQQKMFYARLFDEPSDITENIRIRTTKLKTLSRKPGFDIHTFMGKQTDDNRYTDIFTLYRKFKKSEPEVQQLAFEYADRPCRWMKFTENIDAVIRESTQYICNYAESMELTTDDTGKVKDTSFPIESTYTDNGNYVEISDWVWKRKAVKGETFAFDSDSERVWANILDKLACEYSKEVKPQKVAKQVQVGLKNPLAGMPNLDGTKEPDKINPTDKYLWGKNFITNSEIKYEYCLDGIHSSFPDFVMEDCFGRIHIFEVKSVNIANATSAEFDSEAYKKKINELRSCYKQASILTGHVFYLPVRKDDNWHITQLLNGAEKTLTLDQFKDFVKTVPGSAQVSSNPTPSTVISQIVATVSDAQKFKTHVPVYAIKAACGYFDENGTLPEEEAEGWVDASSIQSDLKDMFVVHATGDSMKGTIHDGDLCLFMKTAKPEHNKIILCKAKDDTDPQASSFTIKKYSKKEFKDEEGRTVYKIILKPENTDFDPIIITPTEIDEEKFKVYGEFVGIINRK